MKFEGPGRGMVTNQSSVGNKAWFAVVVLAMVVTSLEASPWGRVNSWIKGKDSRDAAREESQAMRSNQEAFSIQIIQEEREPEYKSPEWVIRLGRELGGASWLGTSYKNIPYTEGEFNDLRSKKIKSEVKRLKRDHIARKRAARSREGGQQQIEGLLDDLLAGDAAEQKDEEEEFLKDFNEEQVYRRVAGQTFVSQSRPVVVPSLYVQSKAGELFCLELKTGLTSWVAHLDTPLREAPYETEKQVFIVDGSAVRIIDKRSGFITKQVRQDRAVFPKVYFNDNRIYSVSYEGQALSWQTDKTYRDWIYRMSGAVTHGMFGHSAGLLVPLDSGEVLSLSFDGEEKWKFVSKSFSDEKVFLERLKNKHKKAIEKEKGDARKNNRPEDKIFINRHERDIDALQKKIRKLDFRSRGKYVAEPLFLDENVIIGCTDFQLYNLSRYSGIPYWSYSCGAEVKSKALSDADWVWQRDELGRVHRVSLKTGKGGVVLKGVDRVLAPKNDGAVILSKGNLFAWSKKAKTIINGLRSSKDDHLIASSGHNLLVSLRDKDGLIRAYSMESFRALR